MLTAVFLINRLPSQVLENKTPYERLTSLVPDYHSLKTFDCLCYVSTSPKSRNKFEPRAKACVFLGYPAGYKRIQAIRYRDTLSFDFKACHFL